MQSLGRLGRLARLGRWASLGLGALLLVVAFASSASGPDARADGSPAPLDAKARATRRSELKSAVTTWAGHRMRFPSRCPMCKGSGIVPTGFRGGPRFRECTQCKGRKAWISPPDYRACYYDLRTPAFQQLPGIQDALEAQYKEAAQGKPWPTHYDRYRIRDVELVDDTHGIARILYDAQTVGTATHWIWTAGGTGSKKKGAWCLYDARSDGPWPAPDVRGGTGGGWGDVPAAELAALRQAAAGSTTAFWAVEFLAQGDVLRVHLEPRATLRRDVDPAGFIAADALGLFGALFAIPGRWRRIETEWRTWWRNADGTERLKPTWTVSLDRAGYEARGWAQLDVVDRMSLLSWSPAANAGWERVLPGGSAAPPPPAPTPVPAPVPPEPPPTAPEPPAGGTPDGLAPPSTPSPAPPSPAPPPPAAAPPPPPAAAAPKGPPPAMTPEARKKGEAGVAKMRALFAAVKTVYDEAQQAREASTDLYQEKLEEVRARLGEIEEVWQTEVVAAMPGRDDAEKDELANEAFGAVWTEIDALKSIVRKLSRIG